MHKWTHMYRHGQAPIICHWNVPKNSSQPLFEMSLLQGPCAWWTSHMPRGALVVLNVQGKCIVHLSRNSVITGTAYLSIYMYVYIFIYTHYICLIYWLHIIVGGYFSSCRHFPAAFFSQSPYNLLHVPSRIRPRSIFPFFVRSVHHFLSCIHLFIIHHIHPLFLPSHSSFDRSNHPSIIPSTIHHFYYPSIYSSFLPSIHHFIDQSIHHSFHAFIYPSFHPSIYRSFQPSIHHSIHHF